MQLLPAALPLALRPCVSRLARVVCTSAVDEDGLAEAVVDHVALSMRSFPPHIRMALVAGLTALEHGARLHPGARGRPFSAAPDAVQDAVFAALWHSPIPLVKQAIKGLKGLVALAYWDHPDVRERLGYRPDVYAQQVNARRLARYQAEIDAHDRLVVAPNPLQVRGGGR